VSLSPPCLFTAEGNLSLSHPLASCLCCPGKHTDPSQLPEGQKPQPSPNGPCGILVSLWPSTLPGGLHTTAAPSLPPSRMASRLGPAPAAPAGSPGCYPAYPGQVLQLGIRCSKYPAALPQSWVKLFLSGFSPLHCPPYQVYPSGSFSPFLFTARRDMKLLPQGCPELIQCVPHWAPKSFHIPLMLTLWLQGAKTYSQQSGDREPTGKFQR